MDEFTIEVSIYLLFVFQFWHSTWQIFFYGPHLFSETAKVSAYLLRYLSSSNLKNRNTLAS